MQNAQGLRARKKYGNPIIQQLVDRLKESCDGEETRAVKRIRSDRKMRHSLELANNREHSFQNRPSFNNKTCKREFVDEELRLVPYVFIPAFKNETFIMPDRVFAKGKAAKRLHIKLKDSSLFSFKSPEPQKQQFVLKRQEKQKTILSRRLNEQIFDVDDGRKRTEINKRNSQNSRYFRPPNKSGDLLSICSPLLQPRESELHLTRKISLNKTFVNRHKWQSTSKYSQMFNSSLSRTNCLHQRNVSSIL